MSQPQSSGSNERLHRYDEQKQKEQAEYSQATSADRLTVEERETEREVISQAIPGGFERVVNEQRLPAEGIGGSEGHVRAAFNEAGSVKHVESGEYAGDADEPARDATSARRRPPQQEP